MKTAILKRTRVKSPVNKDVKFFESNMKLHINTIIPDFTYIGKSGRLISSKNNIVI